MGGNKSCPNFSFKKAQARAKQSRLARLVFFTAGPYWVASHGRRQAFLSLVNCSRTASRGQDSSTNGSANNVSDCRVISHPRHRSERERRILACTHDVLGDSSSSTSSSFVMGAAATVFGGAWPRRARRVPGVPLLIFLSVTLPVYRLFTFRVDTWAMKVARTNV